MKINMHDRFELLIQVASWKVLICSQELEYSVNDPINRVWLRYQKIKVDAILGILFLSR